jgi:hypothetical protein
MSILKIVYFTIFFFIIRGLFRYLIKQSQKLPPAGRNHSAPSSSKNGVVVDVEFSRKKDPDNL